MNRASDSLPIAAIPAADDRMAIAIREALRDRQAQSERGSTGAAIRPATYAEHVLAVGAL